MRLRWLFVLAALPAVVAADEPSQHEFFEQKIRPVLVTRCAKCHGADKTSSRFRVDSQSRLIAGGERGAAVEPDRPADSLLVRAIKGTVDGLERMPPDKPLPAEVIADFETWIRNGAKWPETRETRDAFAGRHWSFVPIDNPKIPQLDRPWSTHPIDCFIESAWRKHDLKHPARPVEADARTLIRRLSYDLIGLPPPPEDVERFEEDFRRSQGNNQEDVLAREVDRLLASPHYGERWGRHWMDVARYADTAGDNADYPIPEVIQYRDYIIDAFNRDLPFDQFAREQIAGDLMPDADSAETTADRIKATGFLALSRRYATGPYELWHLTIEDTIDTVGRAFLGLTMKCARCHDHKFDPITTKDYYALYGIFESTQFPWAGAEEFQSKKIPRLHFAPLLAREKAQSVLQEYRQKLQAQEQRIAEVEKGLAGLAGDEQAKAKGELDSLRQQYTIAHRLGYPREIPTAYAVFDGTPHNVAIQTAGDPSRPGPTVPRGAIAFLSQDPLQIPEGTSGRLQLAHWLTRPDHPLTARVIVNRLWQHHFGRGLVATSSNFGTSGSAPTHPELLDFLAKRLVENGWSLKSIHRLILSSRTWRLSSAIDEQLAQRDTGNEWLWRQNRRRLDAESIRDTFLAVAGKLDDRRPGPHPFPPIERWNWTQHNQFKEQYDSNHRSVYLMTQRLVRHPFLALFDGPDTNTTTDVRTNATVPTQALYLMNSPQMASIAASFADRLLAERQADADRIVLAYETCYSRSPTTDEISSGIQYLEAVRTGLAGRSDASRRGWLSYCRALLVSNALFYVD